MNSKIAAHYRQLLAKYGDTHRSAQWSSVESQHARFSILSEIGNIAGRSLLDYGCGTGALYEYLVSAEKKPSQYIGCDIITEFFDYAQQKVPQGIFLSPQQLDNVRFDYAIISGVFNNLLTDNDSFWKGVIRSLFQHCDVGLAFNMMSTYVDYRDDSLFYVDPGEVISFVKREITPYITLRNDYLVKEDSIPFEFTVYLYKNPVKPAFKQCSA